MVSELPLLPILSANTDVIDFGEINLENLEGNIEPQTLIIQNPGDLDLIIESIQIQGDDFSIQMEIEGLIIEGQGNTEVPIYFVSNEEGIYQGQVIVQSNVGEIIIDLNASIVIETGLNSIQTNAVKLFPNPNEGQFYLESQEQQMLSFQILNSLGETVLERNVQNVNVSKIDLEGQAKGIYFIVVQTADGIMMQKFLVQWMLTNHIHSLFIVFYFLH